jgi:hypothetical protein
MRSLPAPEVAPVLWTEKEFSLAGLNCDARKTRSFHRYAAFFSAPICQLTVDSGSAIRGPPRYFSFFNAAMAFA